MPEVTPALPPLPEPDRIQRGFAPSGDFSLFTEEQMLAYGEERARVERERAAKVCEAYSERIESITDHFQRGKSVGALECAAAIRDGRG